MAGGRKVLPAPADGKGKRSSFAMPPSPVIIQANVHITQFLDLRVTEVFYADESKR